LIIRESPDALIEFLKKRSDNQVPAELTEGILVGDPLPASKELHTFFKNQFIPKNNIEKAGRWFYLNRTSYSGIMNTQNMYWGYGDKYSMQPKNWPCNIIRTSFKLQNVKITNLDFETVIDEAPDDALLFIDPPYFNADQDKFYQHSFSENDHYRLEFCLRRIL
jgi:DNA adenine methylase